MNEMLRSDKILTIPNFLSLIRILLVPLFAVLYLSNSEYHYYYSALVLLISGATDVLDGIIARKFNLITNLGKILDPIADKLTQAVVIVCLTINHYEETILLFILILLFAKEFTMLLGAVVLLKAGTRPSESKWWGKLGTVMVYFLFVAVLFQDIIPSGYISNDVINVIAIISAICLVFSLFNYYPVFKDIQSGEYKFENEKNSSDKAIKK